MRTITILIVICSGSTLLDAAIRRTRQANFGGGSNSQVATTGSVGQKNEPNTGNRIFFGNPAIDNGLLGAGLGIGGLLLAQNIANSNNQCNCSGRKKRQIQTQDPNQKFFGLFGGNSGNGNCNCGGASNFGSDCKGRPQGDQFYGCGCNGHANGGIFTFGRKKRQINNNGDDLNNKILNFRCIQASLTGRNTNQGRFSAQRLSQG